LTFLIKKYFSVSVESARTGGKFTEENCLFFRGNSTHCGNAVTISKIIYLRLFRESAPIRGVGFAENTQHPWGF